MTKTDIRKIFLEKRKSMQAMELDELSLALCNLFFQKFDLSQVISIHIFLPIAEKYEINTKYIIDRFRSDHPKIKIIVPKSDPALLTLHSFVFTENTCLSANEWKIPEPVYAESFPDDKIDLVFLPLLAFDKRGFRVGYGKGFYDRFLAGCRKDMIKVGLSLFKPVEEISDVNGYDVRMDFCLTPERMYAF